MSEIDHEFTRDMICPWCGYKIRDGHEYFSGYDGHNDEIECPECGKLFGCELEAIPQYTTTRKKCKTGTCRLENHSHYGKGESYIYDGRNWTIWKCEICDHDIVKTAPAGKEPFTTLPTLWDMIGRYGALKYQTRR